MKKSTWLLVIGIIILVLTVILDGVFGDDIIGKYDPSAWGFAQIAYLVGGCLVLALGIILIVVSRRLAKKDKR